MVHGYGPSHGAVETGGLLALTSSQPSLLGEFQVTESPWLKKGGWHPQK